MSKIIMKLCWCILKLTFVCGWMLKGEMQEKGWNQVRHQWPLLLQFSPCDECWRCWWCAFCVHQRVKNKMASHVKKLGAKLAKQLLLEWPKSFLCSDHQQWTQCGVIQCCSSWLVLWADLHWKTVQLLTNP